MKKLLLMIFTALLLMPLSPEAESGLNTNEEVYRFLKDAFEVQVSLSEKTRTKDEITEMLNPYFSKGFQDVFWKENIVEEDGKFVTYGSDFALYYIPFYQFSEQTKVVFNDNTIYVVEFFPAETEGPVGYDDHYEGLVLKKVNREWKIDQVLYDHIPEAVLKEAYSHNMNKSKNIFFSYVDSKQLCY